MTGTPVQAGRAVADDSRNKIGIRLLEAPVTRRHDPRARIYIVDHLAPGTTVKRRIEVVNDSGDTRRIELYPAAAELRDHRFLVAADRTPNELTSWITLSRTALELPPGGKANARITIEVPASAAEGERYAVVWAQTESEPAVTRGVRMVSRVGIRLYLDVGPGGEPASDFRIESLTPLRDQDGRPGITAHVRNTGGRALDMSGALWLSDGPGGLSAGPFYATLGVTLAPGETAPVNVVLDERMPNGPWKVRLALRSGMIKREVSASMTFPDAGVGRSIALVSTYLPAALGGAGLAAVVGVVWVVLIRRRRRELAADDPGVGDGAVVSAGPDPQ